MSEWHTTPDYIVNHWTDELLLLMTEKLAERKERELETLKGKKVSDTTLFNRAKNLIKVKRGN